MALANLLCSFMRTGCQKTIDVVEQATIARVYTYGLEL